MFMRLIASVLAVGLAVSVLSSPASATSGEGEIAGHVTATQGATVDSNANLWVRAYDANGEDADEVPVGLDGTYSISSLAPGDYRLQITDSSAIYGNEFYVHGATLANATIVEVADGATTSNINFVLSVGGTISGSVTGPAGVPLDSSVNVGVTVRDAEGIAVRQADVSANGQYLVTGLATGSYRLHFVASDEYANEYYEDTAAWQTATPIEVTAGEETARINVSLASAAQLTGTVTGPDGAALDPDSYVTADLYDSVGNRIDEVALSADDQGQYAFGSLAAGSYFVGFRDSEGVYPQTYFGGSATLSGATPIIVSSGGTTADINVELRAGGVIHGKVTGTAGAALAAGAQVSVTAESTDGGLSESVDVNSDGTYQLVGLASGDYYVSFLDRSGRYVATFYGDSASASGSVTVAVESGAVTSGIDVSLARAGTITGSVTGIHGVALESDRLVAITAYDADGEFAASESLDSSGHFELSGLAPGAYRLEFFEDSGDYLTEFYLNKDSLASATPVTVAEGATVTGINVELNRVDEVPDPVDPEPEPMPVVPPAPPVVPAPVGPSRTQALLNAPKSLKRKKSKALSARSGAGIPVRWASSTPKVCKVKGTKVVAGKKKGTCKLTAVAASDSVWLPLRQSFRIKIT